MTTISTSPDRHTFQIHSHIIRQKEKGEGPSEVNVELFKSSCEQDAADLVDPEWQKDNLEYDLRTTEWILEKVRNSEDYSKSLYAALCNNDFTKNDVWPILLDKRWHCSWRYAGGVLAHMHETGDYMDWYCAGNEGDVTEEIQADLLKLGWCVRQQ